MKRFEYTFVRTLFFLLFSLVNIHCAFCQEKVIRFPFYDFDSWIVRDIKESRIIGGNEKRLYEIGARDTVTGNFPYIPASNVFWGTSNVYAKVSGVVKGSCSVFPERRGDGYCVRMETVLEKVVVLGLINLKVIATGSIFLGEINEPIRDTKNPQGKLMQGVTFTERPKYLRFDYKTKTGGKRQKASGLGSPSDVEGKNRAEVCLLLQKRWEDSDGNIYAKRVGTSWTFFDRDQLEWVNKFTTPIHYGNITDKSFFKPYMGLVQEEPYYCKNSRGEAKPIQEIGWAEADEQPTHIILRCSSGNGGAYVGAVGDILWIDNIELVE